MNIDDIKKVYFLNDVGELHKVIPKSRRREKQIVKINFKPNDKDGYSISSFKGKQIKSHRLVMFLHLDRILDSEEHVDHRNGNKLDNYPNNLRVVSNRKNHNNRFTHREGKLVGISEAKNGFTAQLRIGKDNVYLGTFNTKKEAHSMYNKAVKNVDKYSGNSFKFREFLGYKNKRKTLV